MQKLITFFAFLFLSIALLCAQTGPIIVQDGSQSWTYPDINTAVAQAPAGAYIYLPGGAVPYTNAIIIIDKAINIIGAGIYPDSTTATDYSNLGNCTIQLANGCDNSSFEGFRISEIVSNNSTPISNIIIRRIRSYNINLAGSIENNFLIYNCILDGGIYLYDTNNITISNNIIMYSFSNLNLGNNNLNVFNNIFLDIVVDYLSGGAYLYFENSNIKNNIFTGNQSIYIYGNCNFKNNYLKGTFTLSQSSSASGNYSPIPPQNILPSYTLPFSYYNNYNIINGSVGDNGGDDGTDVGIYGGLYPWKEGNVPVNPHISTATVSPQSNGQGNIHVNIKVGAQDH